MRRKQKFEKNLPIHTKEFQIKMEDFFQIFVTFLEYTNFIDICAYSLGFSEVEEFAVNSRSVV